MPRIDFRTARAQCRLADVLNLVGFTPTSRHGAQLRGPCPVHRSTRPASRSFAAHVGKGVWHCFHCGAGGNVLDLWAAVSGLPLYEAVIQLCARLGQEVPWLTPPAKPSRREAAKGKTTMPDP
jgi:DNA primase